MVKRYAKIAFVLLVLPGLLSSLTGCETLRALLTLEQPEVRLQRAELTELSFEGAEVTAYLSISNPNPVDISLAGFSWEFFLEGNRFLGGDVSDPIQISANGTSPLTVPVSFGFRELIDTVRSVGEAKEVEYLLDLELRFDLPIIGALSIPVQADGTLPVVRPPGARLASLRLDSISLSGADLQLQLAVRNPNIFALSVDALDYGLAIAGVPWVIGSAPRNQMVGAESESVFTLPFTLQFRSVGRAVRDVLLGRGSLSYELDLLTVISTDLALIPPVELPYQLRGEVELRR